MVGKITGQLFAESRHRHFSELQSLPKGLLPVADVICRFNPLYGQGMSVAALEAEAFCELLRDWQGNFGGLTRSFFHQTDQIIAVPWETSALPDLPPPNPPGYPPTHLQHFSPFPP